MSGNAENHQSDFCELESFSSFSSLDSTKLSLGAFQKKIQEEHEKARKLRIRIEGYKAVVQQLPKCHKLIESLTKKQEEAELEISRLLKENEESNRKVEELRKLLHIQSATNVKDKTEGWTELGYPCARPSSSSSESQSSPSFEVIEKSDVRCGHLLGGPSLPNQQGSTVSWLQKDANKEKISTQTAAVNAQEPTSVRKSIPSDSKPTDVNWSLISECTDVRNGLNIVTSNTEGLEISNGFTQDKILLPNKGKSTLLSEEKALTTSNVLEVAVSSATATDIKSFPSNVKSPPALNGNIKPTNSDRTMTSWNKEQVSVGSEIMQEVSKSSENDLSPPDSSAFTLSTLSTIIPLTSPGSSMQPHQGMNIFVPELNSELASHSQIDSRAAPFGVGARPKEWRPLQQNITSPHTNVRSHQEASSQGNGRNSGGEESLTLIKFPPSSSCEFSLGSSMGSPSPPRSPGAARFNNVNQLGNLDKARPTQSSATHDLIRLGSLELENKVPAEIQTTDLLTSNTPLSQQSRSVMNPSDDQPQLASRAENMVSMLKNGTVSGISEALYKFAEEAGKLEKRLNDSQALIQRQQVNMQNNARNNQELAQLREEVQCLRDENETLLAFIGKTQSSDQRETRGPPEPTQVMLGLVQGTKTEASQPLYPDHPVMKRVKSLEEINAKLFMANKDWHSKWEVLRQQHHMEKEELTGQVTTLTAQVEKLREDVKLAEKRCQEADESKLEVMQRNSKLETKLTELKNFNDSLKTDVENLTKERRRLEGEIRTLKNPKNKEGSQSANKEMAAEIGWLKQQISVFAEDFEKERRDREVAETKVVKMRKEKSDMKITLENKLKSTHTQMKAHEENLRIKTRQNVDLHDQISRLKLQLQAAMQKSAPASPQTQLVQPPHSSLYNGPETHLFYPSVGPRFNPSSVYSGNPPVPHDQSPPAPQRQTQMLTGNRHIFPEHLPGAWTCPECTYINYPDRTVCDICGFQKSPDGDTISYDPMSGRTELHSRFMYGNDVPDVVVDSDKMEVH